MSVLVALAMLAFASPSAQASLGVAGFTGSYNPKAPEWLLTAPRAIAVNNTGNGGVPIGTFYVAEGSFQGRISQFDPSGKFVRAFGQDVVASGEDNNPNRQRVSVDATGGNYRLRMTSGSGEGHLTSGSNQVTQLATYSGAFRVGDGLEGFGIPPGTTVTAVGSESLQLSAPATAGADPFLHATETTADIPATAPASTVEGALNVLPTISEGGGSVTVSGGPGNVGATNPYLVTFGPELSVVNGSTPLSGGAAAANAATINQAGGGFEVCKAPPSNDVCKLGFASPYGVAVNQATGDVYTAEELRVVEFSSAGAFIRAFGHDVVSSGPHNVIPTSAKQSIDIPATVTGGTFTLSFGDDTTPAIAYNASAATVQSALEALASIGAGNIGVSGGEGTVAPFAATFSGALSNNPEPSIAIDSTNLVGDVGSASSLKAGASVSEVCLPIDSCRRGSQDEAGGSFGENPATRLALVPVGAPNEGNVLAADPVHRRVQEFTPSGEFIKAFGFDVVAAGPNNNGSSSFEECEFGDACKAGTSGSGLGQFAQEGPNDIAVDSTGAIYTVESSGNFRVQKFTPQVGPPGLSPAIFGTNGAPDGTSSANTPTWVAIGQADHVLVAKSFPAGATAVCPNGSASNEETRIQELSPDGTALLDTHMACNEINPIRGLAANLSNGNLLVSSGPQSQVFGYRVYSIAAAGLPTVSLSSVSEETTTGAKITGVVNPNMATAFANSPTTSYHLEYKLSSTSSWTQYVPDISVGFGTTDVPVSVFLNGLDPNRSYDVRLVATKQFGEGVVASPPQTFTTLPAPPQINSFSTSHVTATSADLHAEINPLGEDTLYRFEYGTTPDYGSIAPIPDGELAASPDPQQAVIHISGLEGGTYHFRVVAENDAGVSTSGDQTFTFYPPGCPNAGIRAQTGASFLPDCRAYELVTPANAGNTKISAKGPFAPQATSPSRLAFGGGQGFISGTGEPPAVQMDVYVATRHNDGWVTRYTGIPADEKQMAGGPPRGGGLGFNPEGVLGSLDLAKILDWDRGWNEPTAESLEGSYAPYLWNADGSLVGRLPTNLAQIPGAELDLYEGGFVGESTISPDFSHFFISTSDLEFSPGGLTVAPGSAYVNDLQTGAITVISKTPLGSDIPQDAGNSEEFIRFRGVSTDGSHALMSTEGPNGTEHLYMSVDATDHYDVSVGEDGLNHGVKYAGMTPDGSTVYFTSSQQLTADDHDNSADLFMWQEGSPLTVTRISKGTGGGDSDGCSATWTDGCGVASIATGVNSDNTIAAENGDIYFLSPEQLEAGKGTPGERNLYLFDGGQARFVATLFNGTVDRIQVSPTNDHMAFMTASKLTAYQSNGHREMYSFEPSSGALRCVSCIPDGSPPSHDVQGSLDGLFMTDDGRTFFSTADALVPEDTNGGIDSYEFVDNRPQLLSSGTADRTEETGFFGVTANGLDAYFLTLETFVPQDTVGPFRKVYDARTGGGIPFDPPAAPCAAADECHGPSSPAPSRIVNGTGASLGAGGNLRSTAAKHHRKRQHHKHRRKKAHLKGTARG